MCNETYMSVNAFGNSPATGDKIKFVFDNKSSVPVLIQEMKADGTASKGVVVNENDGWTIRSSVVNGVWMLTDDKSKKVIKHI